MTGTESGWLGQVTTPPWPGPVLPQWTGKHLRLVRCPQCHRTTVCERGSYVYCDYAGPSLGGTCGWELRRSTRARRAELTAVGANLAYPCGTIVRILKPRHRGPQDFYAGTWTVVAIVTDDNGTRMRLTPTRRNQGGALSTRRREATIEQLTVWKYGYTF